MTNRELMQGLLTTGKTPYVPMWLMGFEGRELLHKIIPAELIHDVYEEYPVEGEYGFAPMGPERLEKAVRLNEYIHGCALAIGNGAGAAFGHGGPGEFNKKVIERNADGFKVEYETGAKKLINFHPHYTHTYEHPVTCEEDLPNLRLPDPHDPARYAGFAQDVAWAKEHGQWTVAYVNGIFSACHYFVLDYQEFMMDLLVEPELCNAILEKVGSWTVAVAEELCKAGVDCVAFCDDLGSGQSMLISPELYREFIKPWHKKLCDTVHAHGAVVHMHSHGAIMPILEDIVEIGVDILNPVDPDDKMPIDQVKEILGDKVVICGGMDKHFWDWDSAAKRAFLEKLFAKAKAWGRFILMDSGGVPGNVTEEEFRDFLEMYTELR